eukprot:TRINITY_DN6142_c0_g1_i1.p1 TRINITY_DN6142_c0_g1~~TRINITY_DN6142_c0_g1_i1.p1  ORF type:complete len:200 (+),score=46.46 TRINITY_DN6142_c0_g1_i1:81-680(+)
MKPELLGTAALLRPVLLFICVAVAEALPSTAAVTVPVPPARCGNFTAQSFANTVSAALNASLSQIAVVAWDCGTNVSFICQAVTVAEADALCNRAQAALRNQSSALFAALGLPPTTASERDKDGSNGGLYGLFALLILIPLAVAAILCSKRRRKAANNHYLNESTTTFSAVNGPAAIPMQQTTTNLKLSGYETPPRPLA